jgi:pyruvate dehydrogenase E1 component alpha subunit
MGVKLADEILLEVYKKMILCRLMEEKHKELLKKGKMFLMGHLGIGQEAVSVGASAALQKDDFLFPTHRGLGEFIGKGMNIQHIWDEYLGKRSGLCKGKGTLHLSDKSLNIAPVISCLGSNVSMAVGTALASKMRKTNQVTVFFTGEGAAGTADMGPSMCMSSLWQLPIIFVIVSNEFCGRAHRSSHVPTPDVAPRADGYGIPYEILDGQDIEITYKATLKALEHVREGNGPFVLEFKTFRIEPHHTGLQERYIFNFVTPEEIEEWKRRDPIKLCKQKLIKRNTINDEKDERLWNEIREDVEKAVANALHSPDPTPEDLFEDIYERKGVNY